MGIYQYRPTLATGNLPQEMEHIKSRGLLEHAPDLVGSYALTIRPMISKDHEQIRSLYIDSIKRNEKGFIQNLSYHGDIVELGQKMIDAGGDFAVTEHRGKIVGFGGLKPDEKEGAVELCKLHLLHSLQGVGIGKQMTKYLLLRAKQLGFTNCILHVTTSQTAAIGLYKTLGFIEDKCEVWRGDICGKEESFECLFMHKNIS
ncbi:MAG: GNAT family N-acetyltransferase [Pseudomonadota bacterium]|nr:GNAT family N-acetyltransferase [Pseudomonadota bacterium]